MYSKVVYGDSSTIPKSFKNHLIFPYFHILEACLRYPKSCTKLNADHPLQIFKKNSMFLCVIDTLSHDILLDSIIFYFSKDFNKFGYYLMAINNPNEAYYYHTLSCTQCIFHFPLFVCSLSLLCPLFPFSNPHTQRRLIFLLQNIFYLTCIAQ